MTEHIIDLTLSARDASARAVAYVVADDPLLAREWFKTARDAFQAIEAAWDAHTAEIGANPLIQVPDPGERPCPDCLAPAGAYHQPDCPRGGGSRG
jgi:hypothetical protein